jgi:antitoxin component YwqK of YwqJK toxin-antitoxin module
MKHSGAYGTAKLMKNYNNMMNNKEEAMLEKLLNKQKAKGAKNGKWKEFNKHAVLIAEGHYLRDLKHGLWRQYYETGELLIEEVYHHGILHGRYAAYHLNGKVMSEGHYVHGNREGYFRLFDEQEQHIRSLLFINNMLVEEEKAGVAGSVVKV